MVENSEKLKFYVSDSSIRSYRNSILMAKMVNTEDFREKFGDRWNFSPIERYSDKETGEFLFHFNSRNPIPDNFFTGTKFDLYSNSLIELIRDFNVDFEVFPSHLIDLKRNIDEIDSHKVFHLLSSFPAINWEKTSHRKFCYFDSLTLREEALLYAPPLFVNSNNNNMVLMREDLKNVIEDKGLTGFTFYSLDDYVKATSKLGS